MLVQSGIMYENTQSVRIAWEASFFGDLFFSSKASSAQAPLRNIHAH